MSNTGEGSTSITSSCNDRIGSAADTTTKYQIFLPLPTTQDQETFHSVQAEPRPHKSTVGQKMFRCLSSCASRGVSNQTSTTFFRAASRYVPHNSSNNKYIPLASSLLQAAPPPSTANSGLASLRPLLASLSGRIPAPPPSSLPPSHVITLEIIDKSGSVPSQTFEINLDNVDAENMIHTDSVLRKRRLKMKKHKHRKRRKAQRALRRRLGK
ncbi:mitochondrial 37S ribosomal protein mS38 [Lodderomyces beijingensis]|uniref:Small ribosomal subunit protein mS38 n=1 Tax=Lodderomyces beijingensis TaxID=1775926 RepID=A0ABP0ZWD7_9ASCO